MSQDSDSEIEFESADEGESEETTKPTNKEKGRLESSGDPQSTVKECKSVDTVKDLEEIKHVAVICEGTAVKDSEESGTVVKDFEGIRQVTVESEGTTVKDSAESNKNVTVVTEVEKLPDSVYPQVQQPQPPGVSTTKPLTVVNNNKRSEPVNNSKPKQADVMNKDLVPEIVKDLPPKMEKVLLLKEKKELERTSKTATTTAPKEAKLAFQSLEEKSSPGWGLVGGWSSSFLSSMASSASTFTSHVTQGIGTVLETVEASLGVPSPEEMAAIHKMEEKEEPVHSQETPDTPKETIPDAGHGVSGILGGVSAFTRVLESTGSKVITGGLDTLELIGKKTMDILTEGDPGLRKKRTVFGGNQTTLSQVLREAKDRHDDGSFASEESFDDAYSVCYSKIFDEFQGLVHLEALEILSSRSKSKLEEELMMLGPEAESLHDTLKRLRTTCLNLPPTDDTPDDEISQDFDKLLKEHMTALPINLNIDKIKAVQAETRTWVDQCKADQDKGTVREAKEIYEKVITSLAELTARSMELFHKMCELLLVTGNDLADLQSFAQHFTGLTAVLCTEIRILTSQFCMCLSTAADDSEDPDAVNPLITNVFVEATNSSTYIQDAFQLLIPVFQELAVRK